MNEREKELKKREGYNTIAFSLIHRPYLQKTKKKMLSIKPLRPAHREKKRYIVYEAEFEEETFNMFSFQEQLVNKLKEMLGVFESAQAGILPIKVDKEQHKGILRVNNNMVDKVRACFVLVKELDKKPVRVSTKRISGILKKAKELEGFPKETKKSK